jgi:hypothetical protein
MPASSTGTDIPANLLPPSQLSDFSACAWGSANGLAWAVELLVAPEGVASLRWQGIAMNDEQRRFEIWLRAWSSERIGPVAALLDYQEHEHMAEVRAVELIQLSREKGFRDNLMEIQKAYGSVLAYVKHLIREADFARSPDSGASGDI